MTLACWFKANPGNPWQRGVIHGFEASSKPVAFITAGEIDILLGSFGEGRIYLVPLDQVSMGMRHPGNVEFVKAKLNG